MTASSGERGQSAGVCLATKRASVSNVSPEKRFLRSTDAGVEQLGSASPIVALARSVVASILHQSLS